MGTIDRFPLSLLVDPRRDFSSQILICQSKLQIKKSRERQQREEEGKVLVCKPKSAHIAVV
jgi:hypothetical protein